MKSGFVKDVAGTMATLNVKKVGSGEGRGFLILMGMYGREHEKRLIILSDS